MDKINNTNRAEALSWWKSLTREAQINYWINWKRQLPITSTLKSWEFQMVTMSTSVINVIYDYTKNRKSWIR